MSLPAGLVDTMEEWRMAYAFFVSITIFCSIVTLSVGLLALWEEAWEGRLGREHESWWRFVTKDDNFQLRVVLLLMSAEQLAISLLGTANFFQPASRHVTLEDCQPTAPATIPLYYIFFMLNWIFLYKKGLIVYKQRAHTSFLITICKLVGGFGAFFFVPFVLIPLWSTGNGVLPFLGMCFVTTPTVTLHAVFLAGAIVFAICYMYLFIEPILHLASQTHSMNEASSEKLMGVARWNAKLGFISLICTITTPSAFIAAVEDATIETFYLVIMIYVVGTIDLTVNLICAHTMTLLWLPKRWRQRIAGAELSAPREGSTMASAGGANHNNNAAKPPPSPEAGASKGASSMRLAAVSVSNSVAPGP